MSAGKVIGVAVILLLGWQQQVLVRYYASYVANVSTIVQTYTEMESFRGSLSSYIQDNGGQPPVDLGTWLNKNFSNPAKPDLGIDFFGNPYQLDYESIDWRTRHVVAIRSCGIDGHCITDDDLTVPLK